MRGVRRWSKDSPLRLSRLHHDLTERRSRGVAKEQRAAATSSSHDRPASKPYGLHLRLRRVLNLSGDGLCGGGGGKGKRRLNYDAPWSNEQRDVLCVFDGIKKGASEGGSVKRGDVAGEMKRGLRCVADAGTG